MTTRILNSILTNHLNRVLELSDEQFNQAFKSEIMTRRFDTHGELIAETMEQHLGRFLDKQPDIRYTTSIQNGDKKHFFKKVGIHEYP